MSQKRERVEITAVFLAVIFSLSTANHHPAPLSILHQEVEGEVLPCCGAEYRRKVLVNNAACTARPAVIVTPRSTEDVSRTVKFAKRNGLPMSVRSGGHGYTCNQLKQGSILIDLRGLKRIKLVQEKGSSTGLAAILEPGATWGDVQRKISPKRYSYPHGQCRSVGVGGYILGGGVNWLGTYNKYGYAAEQVLSMRIVTANGTIMDLEPGHSTVYPQYQHESIQHITPGYEDDLFFAMRGAGASFAIATEFLYTIHKTPETNPAVLLAWVDNKYDLINIQKAATESYMYSIALNNEYSGDFWNSITTRIAFKLLPVVLNTLKLIHMRGNVPVYLFVTDIRTTAGQLTDPVAAAQYLKSHKVKLVTDNPMQISSMDKLIRSFYDMIIDEQESQAPGAYSLASINLGGMVDTIAFDEEFFNNHYFGIKRENNQAFRNIGCDYCAWLIHFRNRQSFPNPGYPISTNTDNNTRHAVDINVNCQFRNNWDKCPTEVLRMKKSMEKRLHKYNRSYSKYIGFPSCDSEDWMWRYWGSNYYQLLAIKAKYDPDNVFSSCQSVGSRDNACCPFSSRQPNGRPPPLSLI